MTPRELVVMIGTVFLALSLASVTLTFLVQWLQMRTLQVIVLWLGVFGITATAPVIARVSVTTLS